MNKPNPSPLLLAVLSLVLETAGGEQRMSFANGGAAPPSLASNRRAKLVGRSACGSPWIVGHATSVTAAAGDGVLCLS